MADRYIPDDESRWLFESGGAGDPNQPYYGPASRRFVDRMMRTTPTSASGASDLTSSGPGLPGGAPRIDRGNLGIPDAALADIMRAVNAVRAAGDLKLAANIEDALLALGAALPFAVQGGAKPPAPSFDPFGDPWELSFDPFGFVAQDTGNWYPTPGHEPPLPGSSSNPESPGPNEQDADFDEFETALRDQEHRQRERDALLHRDRQRPDRGAQPGAGTAGSSGNPEPGTTEDDIIDPWGDEAAPAPDDLIDPWAGPASGSSASGDPDSEGTSSGAAGARLLPDYLRHHQRGLGTFRGNSGPGGWLSPDYAGPAPGHPLGPTRSTPYDPDPNAATASRAVGTRVRVRPANAGWGPDPARPAIGLGRAFRRVP